MKRGRPRLAPVEESAQISVRLTTKQYDETQRQATAERMTMADWIRRMLDNSHPKNRR